MLAVLENLDLQGGRLETLARRDNPDDRAWFKPLPAKSS